MISMVHSNAAMMDGSILRVDRKFHLGMQSYVKRIREPIVSIHPASLPAEQVMDSIDVRCEDLGYQVITVRTDSHGRPVPEDLPKLDQQIRRSRLVYGGGLGATALARDSGVPYILVLEHDLQTRIALTSLEVNSPLRKAVRSVRKVLEFASSDIANMARAHGLHCNGYPAFHQTRWFNGNRLLYLDSRMSAEMVISEVDLSLRLENRSRRPLRLLYSGRYEPMKGASDAVRVGVECVRRGLEIEMHCYGQGSLSAEMRKLASDGDSRIKIHDAIPYPELVKISQSFDIFVCCHIQSDPSCTYLESFGAGLPIVGYANRMWQSLRAASGVGFASPMGRPAAVVDDIAQLAENTVMLAQMSRTARQFAITHAFEAEFNLRVDDINAVLAQLDPVSV